MHQSKKGELFGRLAVQAKLITMDQLARAVRAQGRAPQKRLGEILVEHGALSPAQLESLLELQRRCLDKVGQKRRRSPAAAPLDVGSRPPSRPSLPSTSGDADAGAVSHERPALQLSGWASPHDAIAAPTRARTAPSLSALLPLAAVPTPAGAAAALVKAPRPGGAADLTGGHSAPASPRRDLLFGSSPMLGEPLPLRPEPPTLTPLPLAPPPAFEAGPRSSEEPAQGWLIEVLRKAQLVGASDVHVHSGACVKLRRFGELVDLTDEPLPPAEAEAVLTAVLDDGQYLELQEHGQTEFALELPNVGRYRTSVYQQHRGLDAIFHGVAERPPALEDLGLPRDLARLTSFPQGLVVITGPAGCGKSSTLAALLNIINEERRDHILLLEDPIEIVHPSKRSLVNQRQVLRHTESYARALRAAMREDPDVIGLAELPDAETALLALSAAETGKLVLATMRTSSAVRTIDRLVGFHALPAQPQVRSMLAASLRAIVVQRLLPRGDGAGMVPALEILQVTNAVSELIQDGETGRIEALLERGPDRSAEGWGEMREGHGAYR